MQITKHLKLRCISLWVPFSIQPCSNSYISFCQSIHQVHICQLCVRKSLHTSLQPIVVQTIRDCRSSSFMPLSTTLTNAKWMKTHSFNLFLLIWTEVLVTGIEPWTSEWKLKAIPLSQKPSQGEGVSLGIWMWYYRTKCPLSKNEDTKAVRHSEENNYQGNDLHANHNKIK